MDSGLLINETEFMCLSTKQQMCVLYQNQVETMKLIKGYKFWQKMASIIGAGLVAGMAYLFEIHLNK